MEIKCPDETLRMRGMNLNMCILSMLEDTFSLDAAHILADNTGHMRKAKTEVNKRSSTV